MITAISSNEELLNAVLEEQPKAYYWFDKRYKDNRETSRLRRKITDEHKKTGEVQVGGYVEYLSRSGNRWVVYLRTARTGGFYCTQKASFVYRETFGSIEVIVPMDLKAVAGGRPQGVMVFTSHFFLRMQQRLGVEKIDIEAVIRLVASIKHTIINAKGDSKRRKHEMEISIMGTVWRGIYRNGAKNIIEVKTMLTKLELSRREKQALQRVDKAQEHAVIHVKEIDMQRIEEKDHSLLAEMYDNSFVLDVDDTLSELFFDFTFLTKLTFDRLCIPFDFDEYMQFLLDDMDGEAVLWGHMVESAYDHDSDKRIDDASVFVLCTIQCFGHKFPTGPATEMFVRAYREYWSDMERVFEEHKDFFVLKNKSMFQPKVKMDKLTKVGKWEG